MKIIPFPSERIPRSWRTRELEQVLGACADAISRGEAAGWETGYTERGDPQFYLLGPAPDSECLLCISRLGSLYVLEDGNGRILIEDGSMTAVAKQAWDALARKKSVIVARIAIAWCVVREAIEERTDAVLAESQEMLAHFAPQIAALV